MNELEKVIRGLECCILRDPDDHARCNQCSYGGNCVNRLKMDALELLKAQRPRVMTLEEAENADHCFCEAGSLFVCRIVPVPDGWVTIQQFGRPDMEIDSNEYGISFRCWTTRPTDEQREATPWQS